MGPRAIVVACCLLTAAPAPGQDSLDIRYADGFLSLRAEQVPLQTLLRQVARETGIRIHLAAGLGAQAESRAFNRLPLEEALAELVRPNDLMIFFRPDPGSGQRPRIAALYVFAPATTAREAPAANLGPVIDPEREARRLSQLIVTSGDFAQRRQAIADLALLPSPAAVHGLEAALSIDVPELRREVAEALGRVDGIVPLGQLVLGDGDAQVREAAVHALAGLADENARLFIERALKDADARVRSVAAIELSGFARP